MLIFFLMDSFIGIFSEVFGDIAIFDNFDFFWLLFDEVLISDGLAYLVGTTVSMSGSVYQGNSGTTKSGLFLAKVIRPIYNVIFEAQKRGAKCCGL